MKYIVIEIKSNFIKMELPFVFPDLFTHDEFYKTIEHNIDYSFEGHNIKCISAGFCDFFEKGTNCSGKSESLNIGSRLQIDDILMKNFNTNRGIIQKVKLGDKNETN